MFTNLALEEWALEKLDATATNYLILYINKPSVVLGRNQNLFQEVNLAYCQNKQIEVARRISGGGTVFHDEGNLNWAWISAFDEKKVNRYEWAAQAIIDLLAHYNLKAYLTDRNAIEVDGMKLSGQAQFTKRKNILSHGTLLIDADLSSLQPAIEMDKRLRIESKARPSVRSQTANLNALTGIKRSPMECAKDLLDLIRGSEVEFDASLVDREKFRSKNWIINRSPKFRAEHTIGDETFHLTVEKGIVVGAQKADSQKLITDSPFLHHSYEKLLSTILQ